MIEGQWEEVRGITGTIFEEDEREWHNTITRMAAASAPSVVVEAAEGKAKAAQLARGEAWFVEWEKINGGGYRPGLEWKWRAPRIVWCRACEHYTPHARATGPVEPALWCPNCKGELTRLLDNEEDPLSAMAEAH